MSGTSTVELPEWTPDGSRIVFVSDRSGSLGLWSIRVADGKPAGEPELLSTNDLGNARVMRFARDGSLYYGVNLSQTDIYVAGLDPASGKLTAEPRRVNERAVGNSWGRVAWLPDGKSLSFWNRKPIAALVVHTLATAEVREIWGGKSGRTGPGYSGWFQDGNSLMSVARQPDGQPWVFSRVDSRTGDVQATWTVAGLPVDSDSWFSPDLMTMFFVRKDEAVPCEGARCTYALVARDIQTGRDREIVRHSANRLWGTSISSDGRNVAFIARDPLGTSIMIAPSAGGPSREIYRGTNDGYFWSTAWARDGGHLLALHNQAPMPGGELWSFPAKGGPPEKSPLRVRPSEKPAVSPDGTQIAFVGGSAKSEVWVMTGLLKDAKKAPER